MDEHRPPYREALIASIGLFSLYAATLAPTTAFWDTSEYIATAHILGIPHPPGNPLFVVLAKVWTILLAPLGLSVAVRVNLLAAFTSATASGFLFLVAHRIGWGLLGDHRRALVVAGVAVLLGGTSFTVWNQSNVNEKVYTISVLVIAAVTWLALRWKDRRNDPDSVRLLLIAGYLMVLGWSNHTMSLLPLPAFGVFVLLVSPSTFLRRDVLVRAVPLLLIGLSFNVFLPIRAAERPVINEGDPLCDTAGGVTVAVVTNGRGGCPTLASVLSRDQYGKPAITLRQAPLTDQIHNYFQYFDWQWARGLNPSSVPGNTRLPVTMLFLGLGFLGLFAIWRVDREIFAYVGALTATVTIGLVVYLNFKYGYSLAPEVTDQSLHEVRERDYFFIASFIVWGNLAGIGLADVWRRFAAGLESPRASLAAAPILLIALVPLLFNWSWATRAGDHAARDWAYDLLQSVEPYGVLFTNGDNDTFPLWYLQEVEGIRKDVTVIVLQYLFTDWYPKQLQELTEPGRQRPFDPDERTAGFYTAPGAPTHATLSIPHEDMDRIVGGRTTQDFNVPVGTVVVAYPEGLYLGRGERLALAIIRDSIDERPIYFASSGGLISSLGLQGYGVKQGLATRLTLGDPAEDPGLVKVDDALGGDWVDVERSRRLADSVFLSRGLRDRDVWSDRATLNIPLYYYIFSLQMVEAAIAAGLPEEEVARFEADAQAYLVTAQGGSRGLVAQP